MVALLMHFIILIVSFAAILAILDFCHKKQMRKTMLWLPAFLMGLPMCLAWIIILTNYPEFIRDEFNVVAMLISTTSLLVFWLTSARDAYRQLKQLKRGVSN